MQGTYQDFFLNHFVKAQITRQPLYLTDFAYKIDNAALLKIYRKGRIDENLFSL